jgi:deoxycytidylate deaminase
MSDSETTDEPGAEDDVYGEPPLGAYIGAGPWPSNGELIVGLVAPIGVDLEVVADALSRALDSVAYGAVRIRITDVLTGLGGEYGGVVDRPEDKRYHELMDRGNRLRERVGHPDAMARLAVVAIGEQRERFLAAEPPVLRRAYLVRSLKRPEEIESLRRLYGENFVLVAAYGQEARRAEAMARRIAASRDEFDHRAYLGAAYELIRRDEGEEGRFGQSLRDSFWRADLFVDPSDDTEMQAAVKRFVELLFGRRISTPTKDENAIFAAWAAALRSGSLARQVGAVIVDDRGSVLASGTNEVPRAFGGVYWEDDPDDSRDHLSGVDRSDELRRRMVAEFLKRLNESGWLAPEMSGSSGEELAERALYGNEAVLGSTRVRAVMEYVRAVHSEQVAITDAARLGIRTHGAMMAVTTFPCHECARLIVAAGIRRVCYVEPYPKSLVDVMYPDSISVGEEDDSKVVFEPFLGVAPSIYARVFMAAQRKDERGSVVVPAREESQLRLTYGGSRPSREVAEANFVTPLSRR